MITSNKEHKKAKLENLITAGKVAVSVSLAGTVVTVSIFVHTNVLKTYDVSFKDDLGSSYSTSSSVVDMVSGDIDDTYLNTVINNYNNFLNNTSNYQDESGLNNQETLVYDEKKKDEDIVNLSPEYKSVILESLLRDDRITEEEYNNKKEITVGDLEKLTSISLLFSGDISWLNYCTNLSELELNFSQLEDLESLQQIRSLNINRLHLYAAGWGYEGQGIVIDENNFPFLKNCPNLSDLSIDSSVFSIDPVFFKTISNGDNKKHLRYYGLDGSSQSIAPEVLENAGGVVFYFSLGNGIYDLPLIFSQEDFNKFIKDKEKFVFRDAEGRLINYNEDLDLVNKVNNLYNQIDKDFSAIDINANMSEKEKLNAVLEYVLNNLVYNEKSIELQQQLGIKGIDGSLPEELADETKKSYENGILYGVYDEQGKVICGNYAAYMNVLLNRAGVKSFVVGSRSHAYNLVNVNGEYYYVDPTFLDDDVIDMDLITNNDIYLVPPGLSRDLYKTEITPAGVEMPVVDVEKRAQQVIDNAKDEYIVKFKGQIYNVSFTVLMSILTALGLAISKKKLDKEEQKEDIISVDSTSVLIEFIEQRRKYDCLSSLKEAYSNMSQSIYDLDQYVEEMKGVKR